MKKSLILLAVLAIAGAAGAETLWTLDFETAGGYSTDQAEFTDGSNDYFTRTDGSNISSGVVVNGAQGSYYFAAQDVDAEGGTSPMTISITGIDITGKTGLSFSGMFAEDDDGTDLDWDEPDYVHVNYQIDAGGFQNLLWLENNGDTFNSAPFVDTDFDGTGDGTEITDTFQTLTAGIAGTGSTLDLQIVVALDSGDEDIAIDNLQVTAVPEPMTMGLLGVGGVLALIRRKK